MLVFLKVCGSPFEPVPPQSVADQAVAIPAESISTLN